MEFRASWFSENSDRGIAISVSILSSGFSDALFVCFWWLVTLERLLAICIQTFLILQVLNLKPPTWTSRIRIFWLWSEFPACYPKKNANQNILIAIRISWLLSKKCNFFWLWSELSDCDQNFLIVIRIYQKKMQIRIFWLRSEFSDCYPKKCKSEFSDCYPNKCKSEFSDCDQDFLIVIRIFWLWSEVSDCDQKFLIVIRIFSLWSELFWLWPSVSDWDQKFLIVIRIILIVMRIFW
jgi:hypothetical protein